MAIKVNGTTVINDSRVLENVTGFKNVGGQSILGDGNISVGVSADHGTITQTTVGGVSTATFNLGTGTLFKHTLPGPTSEITSQTFAFTEALTSTQGGSWKFNIDAAPTIDNWRLDNWATNSNLTTDASKITNAAIFINKTGTQAIVAKQNSLPTYFNANGVFNLTDFYEIQTTTTPWDFTSSTTQQFPSTSITFNFSYPSYSTPSWRNATFRASDDGAAIYIQFTDSDINFVYRNIYLTLRLNTPWDFTSFYSLEYINSNGAGGTQLSVALPILNTWAIHSSGTKLTTISNSTQFTTYTLTTPYNLSTLSSPAQTNLPAGIDTAGVLSIKLAYNDQHVFITSVVTVGSGPSQTQTGKIRRYNLPSNTAANITTISDTTAIQFITTNGFTISAASNDYVVFKTDGSIGYSLSGFPAFPVGPPWGGTTARSTQLNTYSTIVWPNNLTWPTELTPPTIGNTTKQVDILTFDGGNTYQAYYPTLPPAAHTPKVRVKAYADSGIHTVASDVAYLEIMAVGGGGAGGAVYHNIYGGINLDFALLSQGGLSGNGAHFVLTTLSSSYTITIGAAGMEHTSNPLTQGGSLPTSGGTTSITNSSGATIVSLPGGAPGRDAYYDHNAGITQLPASIEQNTLSTFFPNTTWNSGLTNPAGTIGYIITDYSGNFDFTNPQNGMFQNHQSYNAYRSGTAAYILPHYSYNRDYNGWGYRYGGGIAGSGMPSIFQPWPTSPGVTPLTYAGEEYSGGTGNPNGSGIGKQGLRGAGGSGASAWLPLLSDVAIVKGGRGGKGYVLIIEHLK